MTQPPTDPAAWLASTPRLALYARIRRRPQQSFWQRLFDAFEEETAIGELVLDAEGLRSTVGQRATLSWSEPLVVQLSAWQGSGELGLTLRQQRSGRCEIGLRTLASAPWLEGLHAPSMQELHPFVLPEHVAPLWNALRWFAQVHGTRALPPWPEPAADLLAIDSAPPAQLCTCCSGYLLVSIGAQAYRCTQCGYEGGEGYAAMLQAEHRAELEALTGDDRRERLASLLEDTRIALSDTLDKFMVPLQGSDEAVRAGRTLMLQASTTQAILHLRDARILAPPALDEALAALITRLEPCTRGDERPGRTLLETTIAELDRSPFTDHRSPIADHQITGRREP